MAWTDAARQAAAAARKTSALGKRTNARIGAVRKKLLEQQAFASMVKTNERISLSIPGVQAARQRKRKGN